MATYHVRYVHKVSPRDTDVDTVSLPDEAFRTPETLAKALRSAGKLAKGARIGTVRLEPGATAGEPGRTVLFPVCPGLSTYWHAIILTLIPSGAS